MARAVIKRRGLGISPGYYERLPRLLSKENKRKIEPKEIPSCLIPRPLVVFTRQLEILVTTLSGTSNMALLFFPQPPVLPSHLFLLSCEFCLGLFSCLKASLESSGPWFLHLRCPNGFIGLLFTEECARVCMCAGNYCQYSYGITQ